MKIGISREPWPPITYKLLRNTRTMFSKFPPLSKILTLFFSSFSTNLGGKLFYSSRWFRDSQINTHTLLCLYKCYSHKKENKWKHTFYQLPQNFKKNYIPLAWFSRDSQDLKLMSLYFPFILPILPWCSLHLKPKREVFT